MTEHSKKMENMEKVISELKVQINTNSSAAAATSAAAPTAPKNPRS